MFKIYRLEVKGIPPFLKPKSFTFSPFFTLIRGENGAGKTTMLEALALLGHCCVMDDSDEQGAYYPDDELPSACYAEYVILLGECCFDGGKDEEVSKLADDWNKILNGQPLKKITIRIFHKNGKKCDDLKEDLKEENRLNENWAVAGDTEEVSLIKRIIAFSRPAEILSEKQAQTDEVRKKLNKLLTNTTKEGPISQEDSHLESVANSITEMIPDTKAKFSTTLRSNLLEQERGLPPFICYFNTDMYHYGLGLDIRESPKHLSEELLSLVKNRLHLVNEGRVINFSLIQKFWDAVYQGAEKETLESIKIKKDKKTKKERADITVVGQGGKRKFLSSGENQTLFLGVVFGALRPSHSVVLLDEPDLHLSLPAGLNMYNEVFRRSIHDRVQVIAVSHLPFVFSRSLHARDFEKEGDEIAYEDFYKKCCKWYEGETDAISAADLSGTGVPKCLGLYYLKKTGSDRKQPKIEAHKQERAAEEAGSFQNHEIGSILSQSKTPPPTIRETLRSLIRFWVK